MSKGKETLIYLVCILVWNGSLFFFSSHTGSWFFFSTNRGSFFYSKMSMKNGKPMPINNGSVNLVYLNSKLFTPTKIVFIISLFKIASWELSLWARALLTYKLPRLRKSTRISMCDSHILSVRVLPYKWPLHKWGVNSHLPMNKTCLDISRLC